MAFRLTPHERDFYPLFTRAAENIAAATDELARLVAADPAARAELAKRVKDAEHTGDELTHEIMVKINTTFVTPFDREDIYRLATHLDDVMDHIDAAADFVVLHGIVEPLVESAKQADVLVRAALTASEALDRLHNFKGLEEYWVEINRLENEGDRVVRQALAGLFERGIDPMLVIRWKDIFERLEDAIDACETTANILEGIVIKNA
jgi:predicted phosphate transport protein (TIGR00153 family)